MRYLYNHYKKYYHATFVICPTESTGTGFWSQEGIASEYIKTSYNDQWVLNLIDKLMDKNKGRTAKNAFRTLLILDDCCNDVRTHSLKSIRIIAGRSRHFHLTTLVSSQTLTSVPPTLRINACILMIGRLNRQSIELLESEFNVGMEKKQFVKMADNLPEYGFLVVNNVCSKSGNDVNSNYGILKIDV